MSEEKKDFLDDWAARDEAPTAPAPEVVETKSEPGTARDDKGRFAKTEAELKAETPAAQPPPVQVADMGEKPPGETSPPPSAPPAEAKMVPESVLVAVRKDFQKKFDDLTRQLNERAPSAPSPTPQAQKPQPPDMFDDPEGYRNWQESQFEQRLQTQSLNVSETIARQQHGDEKIDTALEALRSAADQAAWQHILKDRHPYGALLKWHEKHQVMSQLEEAGGLEALIAARVAAATAQTPAPTPATQQQPSPTPQQPAPPPSLARGGAGNTAAVEPSEDEDFRAAF
jgi:hypothetical protein